MYTNVLFPTFLPTAFLSVHLNSHAVPIEVEMEHCSKGVGLGSGSVFNIKRLTVLDVYKERYLSGNIISKGGHYSHLQISHLFHFNSRFIIDMLYIIHVQQ